MICCGNWQVYTGRGFLSKVLFSGSDNNKFAELDDRLTKCLQDLGAAMQVSGLELQQKSVEQFCGAYHSYAFCFSDRIICLGPVRGLLA